MDTNNFKPKAQKEKVAGNGSIAQNAGCSKIDP
jgi:hypothetical protein